MDTFLYARPDQWFSRGCTVTGTIDPDYQLQWLVDGRLGYPVRAAGGSPAADLSLTLTGASGSVGIVVVGNHNLIVPAVITGDVSASVTPATTRPPNGIQLNPYALLDPVETGVTTVDLDVTGNDETPIIGELVLATVRTLTPVKIDDNQFTENDYARDQAGEFVSVPPYNPRLEGRRLTGSQYYTIEDLAEIRAWWQAQQAGSWPSILIPDPDLNDAWFVQFKGLSYKQVLSKGDALGGSPAAVTGGLWLVSFEFVEYPRSRW